MTTILSAKQMQYCDKRTIQEHSMPALVLMERAALAVVSTISREFPEAKSFAVLCGPGNNGGDGVAIARLLQLKMKNVTCIVLGDEEKFSDQLQQEIKIAGSYCIDIKHEMDINAVENADLVIDALFGIGLSRGLSGVFQGAAKLINASAKQVLAVDIPSGYDTDSGKLIGDVGVKADMTVTFAYMKKGLLLGQCKCAAGKIQVADVGIYLDDNDKYAMLVDESIFNRINKRPLDANKGTLGKLLIIAGSDSIYGACYLSAKSALKTGAGLVKIYTHKNNISSIQQNIPEAMYLGYESYNEDELTEQIKWASTILIGPGLGTSQISKSILKQVLDEAKVPLIIDADGLNLLADEEMMYKLRKATTINPVIITPHLKEMERLTGIPVKDINYDMEKVAYKYAEKTGCIVVLKNFTTVVCDRFNSFYINSGNEGLATPGSGDVLAGAIASMVGQKLSPDILTGILAATYLHGAAGTMAAQRYGVSGVLASNIIEEFKNVIKN